jgi:hypothetical protein
MVKETSKKGLKISCHAINLVEVYDSCQYENYITICGINSFHWWNPSNLELGISIDTAKDL